MAAPYSQLRIFHRIFVRKIFRNSIDGQWWTIHVPSMAIDGICNDHLQIESIGGQAWTIHGHGWNAMESQYGLQLCERSEATEPYNKYEPLQKFHAYVTARGVKIYIVLQYIAIKYN